MRGLPTGLWEGPNIEERGTALERSQPKRGEQKTPQGACRPEVGVKPQGTAGGRSAGAARTSEGTPRDPDALLERVLSAGNLADALRRVEQNKGAPGVDGVRVEDLREHLETVGAATGEEVLAGTYRPKPVRPSSQRCPRTRLEIALHRHARPGRCPEAH